MSVWQVIKDEAALFIALGITLVLFGTLAFLHRRMEKKNLKKLEEDRQARLRVLRNPPGGHLLQHPATYVGRIPPRTDIPVTKKKDTAADYDDALSAPVIDLFRGSETSTPPVEDNSSHHSSSHSTHDHSSDSSHDHSSSSSDSGWFDSGGGSDGGGGFDD